MRPDARVRSDADACTSADMFRYTDARPNADIRPATAVGPAAGLRLAANIPPDTDLRTGAGVQRVANGLYTFPTSGYVHPHTAYLLGVLDSWGELCPTLQPTHLGWHFSVALPPHMVPML